MQWCPDQEAASFAFWQELDFRLEKEYMHFNACEKTFLNTAQKDFGFINKKIKKTVVYYLFHLICLCCYLTAPLQRELSEREDFHQAICHSPSLSPIFTRSITCRLSLSVPAFHNKRRWMSLILCCIVISIIHGTDRAVLGEWVTVEWGGNEYS